MGTRVVFAGTPEFAVPSLNALTRTGAEIIAVYTQPDRPAGRGRQLRACPAKNRALELGLSVRQPTSLEGESDFLTQQEIDLVVVVAYGLIFPKRMLEAPRLGCINVHASLLPRWRGAAPIQRAIEAGDDISGICLMQMEAGLDTGPVLGCKKIPIRPADTAQLLHDRLAELGADLLEHLFPRLVEGTLTPRPQPRDGVTYAKPLRRSESWIDWTKPAKSIERKIRAFNPWPLTRSLFGSDALLIREAQIGPTESWGSPGTLLAILSDRIRVQTGSGSLDILRIQKPGGKVMDIRSFLNGYTMRRGETFSSASPKDAHG